MFSAPEYAARLEFKHGRVLCNITGDDDGKDQLGWIYVERQQP